MVTSVKIMENEEKILEFGIKRESEERRDGGCVVVFDPKTQKYAVYKHPRTKVICLFGGGFDEGENEEDGCLRELREESGLVDFLHTEKIDKAYVHYFNRNKKINRVAYATCVLVILKSLKREKPKLEEHENDFEFMLMTAEEIFNSWKSFNQDHDYDHWIYFLNKAVKRIKELGF
jgi:ADP-ribose pyrophosphatase YjhB (NUDIX family)